MNMIYRSYLLRLWIEDQQTSPLRVMLENVEVAGEQHYFKDLESLMVYLYSQMNDARPPADDQ